MLVTSDSYSEDSEDEREIDETKLVNLCNLSSLLNEALQTKSITKLSILTGYLERKLQISKDLLSIAQKMSFYRKEKKKILTKI